MKAMMIGTAAAMMLLTTPLHAQHVHAIIVGDSIADRQAQRDARQTPYAAPGYGPIDTAAAARDACAEKALYQAGPAFKLTGPARASTMSTGWEVEGVLGSGEGDIPFVCSVRNGSVSGVLLRQ